MKTTVINIYGAPGAGKSTLAAEIYAELSKQGESVELVREVAKEYAWTGKLPTPYEQIHITTTQMLRETSLYGKVRYVVTDSPIELGMFYTRYYHDNYALEGEWLTNCIAPAVTQLDYNINLFVPIDKDLFKGEGRYSNLEESLEIERQLRIYMNENLVISYSSLLNPKTRLEDTLKRIKECKME